MALIKVTYVGLSDMRSMSKSELREAGVGVSGGLKWERRNGFVQHIKDPSDRLLEIFSLEGTFTVEEVDEETGATVQKFVEGVPLEVEAATVVDGNTGESSTKSSPDGGGTPAKGSTGKGRSTGA